MDRATFDRLKRHFNPIEPATEELYVERMDSAWSKLRASRLDTDPKAALLVGAQATGKSSELLHLARCLAQEQDPPIVGLLPLWRQYDTTELDAAKVLFLVAIAVLRIATPDGAAPPKELRKELHDAYVEAVGLERGGPKLDLAKLLGGLAVLASNAVDGGASALFSLLGTASKAIGDVELLSLPGASRPLKASDPRLLRIASVLAECVKWARSQLANAPIAMFVDGLDKLTEPGTADPLFGSTALAQPRCDGFQVVYAAPLSTHRGIEETGIGEQFDFLPVGNFRVFADRAPHDPSGPGFAKMRQMIALRLEAAGVEPGQAIVGGLDSEPLRKAIVASGGIPRFLIKILDRAFRQAVFEPAAGQPAATMAHIEFAIHEEEKNLVRRISEGTPAAIPILREVLDSQQAPREHAQMLIRKNIVLVYENHYDWYRPSPLLDEFLAGEDGGA